jgi:hypothetical protein
MEHTLPLATIMCLDAKRSTEPHQEAPRSHALRGRPARAAGRAVPRASGFARDVAAVVKGNEGRT